MENINSSIRDTKLIRLLQSLNSWEMQRLSAYVHSPYFNKHEGVIRLMESLHEAFPAFSDQAVDRHNLWNHIYSRKPYNRQALSDIKTYLTRLVLGFLAQDQFKHDSAQQRLYQSQAFRKRGMDGFHQKLLQKEQGNSRSDMHPEDHYDQYRWERERVLHLSGHKTRRTDESFSRMVLHLDTHYLVLKLRYGCETLNRNRVQNQHLDTSLLEVILDYVSTRLDAWHHQPLIEAYYRICHMLMEVDDSERYHQASEWIRARHAHLPADQLRDLCAYLLNYCISRINTGDPSFQQALFEQYEWQLETEIILESGWLSPWNFKNMVSLALKMDRFTWATDFINTYQYRLKSAFRENAYRYNLAALYFEQAKYHEALNLLQGVEFEDPFYQVGSRRILLKTYYETESFEALFYLADATEAFFRRTKSISRYQAEIHLNFVRFLRKLSHLHIRARSTYKLVGQSQVMSLKKRILQTKKVAQIDWLTRKLDNIAHGMSSAL